jgi:hypothetical protein
MLKVEIVALAPDPWGVHALLPAGVLS